jgi:ABC-type sugar transport system ATPase subunit
LGRAIVRDPKCFLMDEPLGALDAEFRERMAEELRALHDRMGRRPSTSPTTSSKRCRWATRSW